MRPEREEEIMTVEHLKRQISGSSDIRKELEVQKRKEITQAFKTANFEDLVAKAAAKASFYFPFYFYIALCVAF